MIYMKSIGDGRTERNTSQIEYIEGIHRSKRHPLTGSGSSQYLPKISTDGETSGGFTVLQGGKQPEIAGRPFFHGNFGEVFLEREYAAL